MAFDWQKFHSLSDELLKERNVELQEAAYRSAISRGYYAAHHIAKKRFPQSERFNAQTIRSPHERVIAYLQSQTDKQKKELGRLLGQLRDKRNDADYNPSVDITQQFAKEVYEDVTNFLIDVENLS